MITQEEFEMRIVCGGMRLTSCSSKWMDWFYVWLHRISDIVVQLEYA